MELVSLSLLAIAPLTPTQEDLRTAGRISGSGFQPAVEIPVCAPSIEDKATGNCLSASTVPALGRLYPLSVDFFMNPVGNVGMGTTFPQAALHVQRGAESFLVQPNVPANHVTLSAPSSHLVLESGGYVEIDLFGLNDDFAVTQGGNDRLVVTGDGHVGVGTSNPLAELHLEDSGESLIIDPNGAVDTVVVEVPDSGLLVECREDVEINFDNGSSRLRVSQGPNDTFAVEGDGSVTQDPDGRGLIKAGCRIIGAAENVIRQFNLLPGSGGIISVNRVVAGQYEVDFGADVRSYIFQATLEAAPNGARIRVVPHNVFDNRVYVYIELPTSVWVDGSFFLTVY